MVFATLWLHRCIHLSKTSHSWLLFLCQNVCKTRIDLTLFSLFAINCEWIFTGTLLTLFIYSNLVCGHILVKTMVVNKQIICCHIKKLFKYSSYRWAAPRFSVFTQNEKHFAVNQHFYLAQSNWINSSIYILSQKSKSIKNKQTNIS